MADELKIQTGLTLTPHFTEVPTNYADTCYSHNVTLNTTACLTREFLRVIRRRKIFLLSILQDFPRDCLSCNRVSPIQPHLLLVLPQERTMFYVPLRITLFQMNPQPADKRQSHSLPTLSCFSVRSAPVNCLRFWCSPRYQRISPLHLEFHSPLAHSSFAVSLADPRLSRRICPRTNKAAYTPFAPNNSG